MVVAGSERCLWWMLGSGGCERNRDTTEIGGREIRVRQRRNCTIKVATCRST
jgi:hypothetical protein